MCRSGVRISRSRTFVTKSVAGVALHQLRPARDQLPGFRIESLVTRIFEPGESGYVGFSSALEKTTRLAKMLALARECDLPFDACVIFAHRLRDLGEIAGAPGGHDGPGVRRDAHLRCREDAIAPVDELALSQDLYQAVVERGHFRRR